MRRLRVGVDARALLERHGGLQRYAAALLPALLAKGDDIDWRWYADRPVSGASDTVLTVVPGTQVAPLRPWWEFRTLPAAAAADELDVFFSPYGAVPRLQQRGERPCPVVATLHDIAFLDAPGSLPWKHALYWQWVARRLRQATTVVAVSEDTRTRAVARLGLPPERVVTVPNGVDARFVRQSAEHTARVRARLGLTGEFVLAVAPWITRKNLPVLAEAAARVGAQRGDPLPLVIVGPPDPIAQQPFPHVIAAGAVDDSTLVALMSAATVFAVPSLHEGFGLTLIEAMACGTPCVVSNAGALPEVAGGAARLVEPRSVDAWVDALTDVLANASTRDDLSQRGLARARTFSWERTAAETLMHIERAAR